VTTLSGAVPRAGPDPVQKGGCDQRLSGTVTARLPKVNSFRDIQAAICTIFASVQRPDWVQFITGDTGSPTTTAGARQ